MQNRRLSIENPEVAQCDTKEGEDGVNGNVASVERIKGTSGMPDQDAMERECLKRAVRRTQIELLGKCRWR